MGDSGDDWGICSGALVRIPVEMIEKGLMLYSLLGTKRVIRVVGLAMLLLVGRLSGLAQSEASSELGVERYERGGIQDVSNEELLDVERVGEAVAEFDGPSALALEDELRDVADGRSLFLGRLVWATQIETRYDDNVLFGVGNPTSDVVSIFTGGFDWNYPATSSVGSNSNQPLLFQGSYRGGYELFFDGTAEDNVRNSVNLSGSRGFGRSEVSLSYDLSSGTTPDFREGGRVRTTSHSPMVMARFELGNKLSSTASMVYQDRAVEDNISTQRLQGETYLDYQLASKTSAGFGAVAGTDRASVGLNSIYEQFRLRSMYEATERITADLYGGGEARQFRGDASSVFGPIFGTSIEYLASRATTLGLSAERALRPSNFLPGQIRKDLSLTLEVTQRFFLQYFLNVSGTLGQATFAQSTPGVAALGSQDYSMISTSLSRTFSNGWDAEVFYRGTFRGQVAGRSNALENNQTGIRVSYRF